jgi:type II secretory pathway pseudopilin PulG
MAALLVGMSVMAVMMSAALPVWTHLVQREKEEELIWRGEQYRRAIMLFQRKFANTFPPTIDLLVEQKFLRKKYKDPITGEDFQIIPVGGQARPGASGGTGGTGAAGAGRGGPSGGFGSSGGLGSSGGGAAPQQSQSSLSAPAQQQTSVGQQQQAALGIQGVTSKSSGTSIKLYNGRDKYNEWAFIYLAAQQRPGGVGGAMTPGQQVNPAMQGPGAFGQPMPPGTFGQPIPGGGGFGGFGGGFGPGQQQPGPGMRGGAFTPLGPGSFQPGGAAPPGTGPIQSGGSTFQPVNPGGPQPAYPPVPGGFGAPVRPPK